MRTRLSLFFLTTALVGCGDDGGSSDGGLDGSVTCRTDAECDDGVFCNGVESCDPSAGAADARGCVQGEAPCTGDEVCDAEGERCATPCDIDDDMDDDGEPSTLCGGLDCDDDDPSVFPGNTEICDDAGRDEDCDADTFGFRDQDSDGYPDATCCNGDTCGTDCNDLQANVHPGEAESCDGLDNDCNGAIDDGLASSSTWYPDCDGDLFGDTDGSTVEACARPPGTPDDCTDGGVWVDDGTDCDDSRAGVNPSAPEICDGVDTDCNGSPDAPDEDDDEDGYGDSFCGGPDCRDWNPDINPGASELCDGIDSDCDGAGEDDDDDGFLAVGEACSGGDLADLPRTDCDDDDPTEYVGADDICDGEDDDCDGTVDEGASDFCFLDGAVSVCSAAGTCVFDSCASGAMDCDSDPTNGCDDLDWSGEHCGTCGSPCAFACDGSGGCTDTIAQVDASYEHTCAVMSSGTVWCWGDNGNGELGDGTQVDRSRPRRVQGVSDAAQVAVGSNHVCVRHAGGGVSCWGRGRDGELGVSPAPDESLTPVSVTGVSNVVDVAAGLNFSCALQGDGQLCCWGRNADDRLGNGSGMDEETPSCRATDYVEIEVGQSFGCGMDAGGQLECWGSDSFSQVSFAPLAAFSSFALGHFHACGVRVIDSSLVCWGDNRYLQVGDETSGDRIQEVSLSGVVAVSGGRWHTCAINGSGEVWCWGDTDAFGAPSVTTRCPS